MLRAVKTIDDVIEMTKSCASIEEMMAALLTEEGRQVSEVLDEISQLRAQIDTLTDLLNKPLKTLHSSLQYVVSTPAPKLFKDQYERHSFIMRLEGYQQALSNSCYPSDDWRSSDYDYDWTSSDC